MERWSSDYKGKGGRAGGGSGKFQVSGSTPRPNGQLLTSGLAKHHACKFVMGGVGDAAKTRRSGPQGVINVQQGSDTNGTTIWFQNIGTFGGNVAEGRGGTHGFYFLYHI